MIVPTGRLLAQALRRWQRAAGPYWMYVCAAPFLQPVPIREPSYRRIDPSLLAAIRDSGGDRPHVFVDRGNPESALALTPALMDAGLRVVPIAQRWVSADAVVPSAGLVASLLAFAPAVSRPDPACGYVFVLDGARRGMEGRSGGTRNTRHFDNRYEYPLDRFPPPALLRNRRVEEIRWITAAGVAPDLQSYVAWLEEEGIASKIVDFPPPA